MSLCIRQAMPLDAGILASIHGNALKGSLLARLGQFFLKNTFYPVIIGHTNVAVYTLTKDNTPIGFAIYGKRHNSISKVIKSHKIKLLQALITKLPTDPLLFLSCLSSGGNSTPEQSHDNVIHLGFIAINPAYQSSGYGSLFLKDSIQQAFAHFNSHNLVVETRTQRAYNFYKRNNFKDIGEIKRGNVTFYTLSYNDSF